MLDILLVALFLYLALNPSRVSTPTRDAIYFCACRLVPSLFMLGVLSRVVASLGFTARLYRIFGVAPIAVTISLLCGVPVGARLALSLYEQGAISKKYAEYLLSFCCTASLPFIIGFVGVTLYGSMRVGIMLCAFLLVSLIVTAVVLKPRREERSIKTADFRPQGRIPLREAVVSGVESMISVSACAVFFMVLASALGDALRLSRLVNALLRAVLEFSSGCAAASELDKYSLAVCAFSLAWCGVSVVLQVQSVVGDRLSLRQFLLGRVICVAIMMLLAVIFG